jgi:hypothetical protein
VIILHENTVSAKIMKLYRYRLIRSALTLWKHDPTRGNGYAHNISEHCETQRSKMLLRIVMHSKTAGLGACSDDVHQWCCTTPKLSRSLSVGFEPTTWHGKLSCKAAATLGGVETRVPSAACHPRGDCTGLPH